MGIRATEATDYHTEAAHEVVASLKEFMDAKGCDPAKVTGAGTDQWLELWECMLEHACENKIGSDRKQVY
eukprot:6210408-Pleurochrysis_carterae.AAC.1